MAAHGKVFLGGLGYVDSAQMFTNGSVQMSASQLANYQPSGQNGLTFSKLPDGTMQGYDPYGDSSWTALAAPKAAAPAARPSPSPAARPSAPKRSILSPPSAPEKPTQEQRDEITPPAKGLENTIKTLPDRLRERRRRSYLTGGDNRKNNYLTTG